MNYYLLHFVIALAMVTASALVLGTFAYLRHSTKLGLIYAWYSYAVAVWAFFQIFTILPGGTQTGYFYARLSQIGVAFIPTLFLHFIYEFCESRTEIHKYILFFGYGMSFVTLLCIPTPYFISGVVPKFGGVINFMTPGVWDYLFVLYFSLGVSYGVIRLVLEHIRTTGEHSQLARLFFWGAFFAYAGAGANFFLTFDINIYPWTPFGTYGVVVNFVIVAYALFYYRFIDVESAVLVFQREKLATIGLLASSINHEIRNPLYAARSVLETYLENLKEGLLKKEPKEVTERALKQIDRALDVITKLNRFAKPTSDPVTTNLQASIQEAIKSVLDLVSYEFELDKIYIRNNLDLSLPNIQADQRQLEEILFNLIVNACHAMVKGGGTLTLNSKLEAQNSRAILIIQDTGTGISQEHLKHLFEPFHTTKGDKGTGLGLYITKQLVERNGGKISVQSKEGKGISFVLEFKIK